MQLEPSSMRDANPNRFRSQALNKAIYATIGARLSVTGAASLGPRIKSLRVHGDLSGSQQMQSSDGSVPIPRGTKAIIVLNVPTFASGTNPWGRSSSSASSLSSFSVPSVDDGLLEVVSISTIRTLGIMNTTPGKMANYHARRLAQGAAVTIEFADAEAAARRKCITIFFVSPFAAPGAGRAAAAASCMP